MKVNHIRQNVFPVLAALIWGTAFVAQSVAADHVGPFTFTAARSAVACVFLLVLCLVFRCLRRRDFQEEAQARPGSWRDLAIGGICCGVVLTMGTNLQQMGLETTTSGKAGFITALYIVIVPIAGIFLRQKAPRAIWLSVALAVVGLYLLCVQESFSITEGDWYVLLCSFCFAGHILLIDHFTRKVDGVALSCVQFLVMAVLSAGLMLVMETPDWAGLLACIGPVLYVGIFSSGVGYTLQILAQKDSNPTVVSLLLSLESVFATVAGALILGDRMSGKEYLGCVLMLAAVVLAQLPEGERQAFLDWLFDLEYGRMGLPAPDLVLYLDLPTEVSEKMLRHREQATATAADIHEQDGAYLRRCREGAREIARDLGWSVIDCAAGDAPRTVEDIRREVLSRVEPLLN